MAKQKTAVTSEKPTQREMVLAVLQENGWDTKPRALQDAIKSMFDYELPVNYISNYKSNLKKEFGKGMRGRRKPTSGPTFADLEAVCEMIRRLGVDQVRELVVMAETFV